MIKALPPLQKNEEYVSYDVESLFSNIPLKKQSIILFIKSIMKSY